MHQIKIYYIFINQEHCGFVFCVRIVFVFCIGETPADSGETPEDSGETPTDSASGGFVQPIYVQVCE